MPRPSWNEIQDRAHTFAGRWDGETYEKGESQTFWGEFLDIFGIDRRRHGAFFEYAIKKGSGKQEFIDLRQAPNRAVDRLYRPEPFESDSERVALLFERYQALTREAGRHSRLRAGMSTVRLHRRQVVPYEWPTVGECETALKEDSRPA